MIDVAELLKRPSVEKAMATLTNSSNRPVTVKHVSQWVKTQPADPEFLPGAAYVRTEHGDDIYVADVLPEHMLIHELIHPTLFAEGYPDVRVSEGAAYRFTSEKRQWFIGYLDGILNQLEHHEVHRRMAEDFGLDMVPYFRFKGEHSSAQLTQIIRTQPANNWLSRQKESIDILEMMPYRVHVWKSLNEYERYSPQTYSRCKRMFEIVQSMSFKAPHEAQATYRAIRDEVIRLGEEFRMDEQLNDLWRAMDFPLES